jgi:hypothetical protein
MAVPTIVWRNPRPTRHQRLWSRARGNETRSLYVVMRTSEKETEWEGLPNLEVILGKKPIPTNRTQREGTGG